MLSFAPQRQLPMRRLSTIGALGEASSRCPTSCILVIEKNIFKNKVELLLLCPEFLLLSGANVAERASCRAVLLPDSFGLIPINIMEFGAANESEEK